jgi:antirestriction protein ArdC/predicted nucleotidyltransferase
MADAKTEKQKVKEITDKLEEGLKELFESEKYKSYLTTMSKFHNYSFNNTLLIAMQKPEATLVAGYQAWQKNFNRHVNKGERGIRILAPAPYKIKEERDKLDPVTGEVMLDKDGTPQTEEVEIKIPAFRAVSVFDVSQTDGEPLPELEAKELLSTVEGYEDFINAITYVAHAPIGFEDIPGASKGYFNIEKNRIAVQEGMSESQTLKTMVHETAHSMLHNKEVNKEDILAPAKDRNTKEVEAESIAFTVYNHFSIDTSDYSVGYIAGWSNGKDMKELKSSLDTIRRTASELITGIEEQLREIQRDREIMQDMSINGQEKESFLLIQNSDLSEYSLVNVRGMDGAELVEALLAMNDNDRLSVAAYLESKGAWTTEIANQDTKEFGEHRLDVRYNTDTNEVIDIKAVMELDERAKEPIGADDVILKITHAGSFEVERVTNKTPEEVQGIVAAVYGHTLSYAMEHGEADEYLESHKLDRECKRAIEETIQQNFDGMHLKHDIVKPLAEQYGSERMAFVLANTLQQESWDGRFSRDNKTWAAEFYIPENIVHGMDMNRELIVSSHPAVLDGFIAMFRREVLEKEKEMSAGQGKTQDTSGYDVNHSEIQNDLKPEPERKQEEQPETKEPEPEQNQPERTEHTQALEDMEDEDEIIDLGDETEQVLAQMKKSLKGEQETELAFQIADRFISIQEVDGGYDYSIMGADYKEIDGGVYDNKSNGVGYDVSIREALDDILTDLRENPFDNGTRGNIRDNDEWIPIDYDGLMEKAEAVNRIEPQAQGNVVESFKAKTDELFHEISEMNPAEIEETVKCHVQAQLDQYGMDAEIVDVAVVGSRCRGLEREGSDLDVVVELFTSEREDVLFDTFNGDALQAAIATEGK